MKKTLIGSIATGIALAGTSRTSFGEGSGATSPSINNGVTTEIGGGGDKTPSGIDTSINHGHDAGTGGMSDPAIQLQAATAVTTTAIIPTTGDSQQT